MSKSNRSVLLVAALLLILLCPAVGKPRKAVHAPKPKLDPPEIVAFKYCMLDLDGARLSPQASGADQIHSLELFTAAPPAGVTVTRDCKVVRTDLKSTVANVTVQYRTLAVLDSDHALTESARTETVTFVLQKLASGWHISRPVTMAHASPAVLAVRLADAARTEQDPAKKLALSETVKRLEAWRDEDKMVRVARPEAAAPASSAESKPARPAMAAPAGPAMDEEEPEPQPEPDPGKPDPQAQPEPQAPPPDAASPH